MGGPRRAKRHAPDGVPSARRDRVTKRPGSDGKRLSLTAAPAPLRPAAAYCRTEVAD